MANPKHLAILKRGVEVWNAWRAKRDDEMDSRISASLTALARTANVARALFRDMGETQVDAADNNKADHESPDLRGVDLSGAELNGVDFSAVDLSGADLREAELNWANFNSARLYEANLSGASLVEADFNGADLGGADLSGADLSYAYLSGAYLSGAELTEATLRETALGGVNLSQVKGLEGIRHSGPSTIGIDTIYHSQGKIPEPFLRGAGVPENLITFMKSLTVSALEFYSCFISHSTKDQEFAERLHADLQAKRVRCWFAPHDIQGGKKIHEQIDEAIRIYDKLLLILSDASMSSDWVSTEISKARKRERLEKRRMLFPISVVPYDVVRDWECFDADAGKDSAHEIREYFIPDFSNWKNHDSYQQAFQRLLRDLKAEGTASA
jgi:uncharacterized protein YjbI with pentapeptide repeats